MKAKVYLAGALFTAAEQAYNRLIRDTLVERGFEVLLPQEFCKGITDPKAIRNTCIRQLMSCRMVFAVLEGTDVDSGTAFELGYANAMDKEVYGIRTDFRKNGDDGGLNCMLSQSCVVVVSSVEEAIRAWEEGDDYEA